MKFKLLIMLMAPFVMLLAPEAKACTTRLTLAGTSSPPLPAALLQPSASRLGAADQTAGSNDSKHNRDDVTIVGMWLFNLYLNDTGSLADSGLEQFCADGNESSTTKGVPPTQDNTCYGIWKRTGERTFRLDHLGLNFENNQYTGLFKLTATLIVSPDGNTFTGSYIADQEDLNGNNIPELHAEGPLKAERFRFNMQAHLPIP
jgi:hypothetical protein